MNNTEVEESISISISKLFVTQNTNTNERSKKESNVPTGHKGSKELH